MRISDGSSDVCSSDLRQRQPGVRQRGADGAARQAAQPVPGLGQGAAEQADAVGQLRQRGKEEIGGEAEEDDGNDRPAGQRSEERRRGKSVYVSVDHVGGSATKKKKKTCIQKTD